MKVQQLRIVPRALRHPSLEPTKRRPLRSSRSPAGTTVSSRSSYSRRPPISSIPCSSSTSMRRTAPAGDFHQGSDDGRGRGGPRYGRSGHDGRLGEGHRQNRPGGNGAPAVNPVPSPALGGPIGFDREHMPYRSQLYPFPFTLEPLTRSSLARYVVAEMPTRPSSRRRC